MADLVEQWAASARRVHEALLVAVTSGEPLDTAAVTFLRAAFAMDFQTKDGQLELHGGAFKEFDRLEDSLRHVVLHACQRAAAAGIPLMEYDGLAQAVASMSDAGAGDEAMPGPAPAADAARPPGPRMLQGVLDLVLWLADTTFRVVDPAAAEGAPAQPKRALIDLPRCATLWCGLVEDIMDVGTIPDCGAVFRYTKLRIKGNRVLQWRQGILKVCNSLVKRLSKARDVALCGSILVYLAHLYPMADKSGVNLSGSTNTALPLPLDEVAPGALDSSGEPINEKLYSTFWALQQSFQDTARIWAPGAWAKAGADIAEVLALFERSPVTVAATGLTAATGADAQEVGALDFDSVDGDEAQQAVSYLSSSKLFSLQLRDATFRRYFLVQCLILCQAAQTPGRGEKDRAPEKSGAHPPGFTPQSCNTLVGKIYDEMRRTPDNGAEFCTAIRHTLEREEAWVGWKALTCPPFEERPAALTNEALATAAAAALTGVGSVLTFEPPAKRRKPMMAMMPVRVVPGSAPPPRLPRLRGLVSGPIDNMAGLKATQRLKPDLREYMEPFIQDIIDVEPGDTDGESCKLKHTNKVYDWRAKRMLSRCAASVLETYASCKEDIEVALAHYYPDVKKITEDRVAAKAAEDAAAAAPPPAAAAAAAPADAAAIAPAAADAAADPAAVAPPQAVLLPMLPLLPVNNQLFQDGVDGPSTPAVTDGAGGGGTEDGEGGRSMLDSPAPGGSSGGANGHVKKEEAVEEEEEEEQ